MLASGPGVAEVDIDEVDLPGGKALAQLSNVHIQEEYVLQAHLLCPLHGQDHGLAHLLDGDEEHVRLGLGRLDGEFSFAAADLDPHLTGLRHQAAPMACHLLRRRDHDLLAAGHPRL